MSETFESPKRLDSSDPVQRACNDLTNAATAILGSVDLLKLHLPQELDPPLAAQWLEGLERIELAGRRVSAVAQALVSGSASEGTDASSADRRQRGQQVIIVCDDDESVRQITGEMLRSKGYSVVETADAEEAISRAEALDTPADLLIADLGLRAVAGDELARTLIARYPQMRALLISGNAPTADTGFAFLPKPFDSKRLALSVERVLRDG